MMLKLFLVFSLALSSLVFAGSGVGNGGVSLVCRDRNFNITHAQLLDIYEGGLRYGLTYHDQDASVDYLIKKSLKILAKYPFFLKKVQKELELIKAITVYVPRGHVLEDTQDSFPVVRPLGCNFEQLANYTNDKQLLIAEEIFDELNNLNEAALFLHEAIYAVFRNHRDLKTSELARKLTAHLLASDTNEDIIERIIASFDLTSSPGEISQVIKTPVHPGTNLPLRVNSKDEIDGVCILLGYEKAIPNSAQFNQMAPKALLINELGEIQKMLENVAVLTEITCLNKLEPQLDYLLITVKNPVDPKTGLSLRFSDWSKENGICLLLGYQASISRSSFFGSIAPKVLDIDDHGKIEKMSFDVPKITEILCSARR